MPSLDQVFTWLTSLSPLALYCAAFSLAFIENVFPPFPSDLFIGVCAFVAAPGEASLATTYLLVVLGNVAGATFMYAIGQRYGAAGLHKQMIKRGWLKEEQKLEAMYGRYGFIGMFIGRMIPGVRGVVPTVAGAMRLSKGRTLIVITAAAALWYGVICLLAYHVGANWDEYADDIAQLGRWGAIIGVSLAIIGVAVAVIAIRRRHHRG